MRRSRSELETLVLDAAVDLVEAHGVGIGLEGVTYTRVFRHLEATTGLRITRASVHERLWNDQAAFQAAIRRRLVEQIGRVPLPVVIDLTGDEPGVSDGEAQPRSLDHRPQAIAAIKALLAFGTDAERAEASACVVLFEADYRRRVEVLTVRYTRLVRERGGIVDRSHGLDFDAAIAMIVRAVDATSEGVELRTPFDVDAGSVVIAMDGQTREVSLAEVVGDGLVERLFDFSSTSADTI